MDWFLSCSISRQLVTARLLGATEGAFELLKDRMGSLAASVDPLLAKTGSNVIESEPVQFSLLLQRILPKDTKASPDILLLDLTKSL